jgi:hypothetical protein
MTHTQIEGVRKWANLGFAFVSMIVTVMFFINIPEKNWIEPALYGIFGASYESGKLYMMILVKDKWRHLKRGRDFWVAVVLSVVYFLAASGSAITSLGWVLYSIEKQSVGYTQRATTASSGKISRTEERLNSHKRTLAVYEDRLAIIPNDFTTAAKAMLDSINKEKEAIAELERTLENEFLVVDSESLAPAEVNSKHIFDALGSLVKVDGMTALKAIMLTLVVVLELFLFITAAPLRDDKITDLKEDLNKITIFIDGLFGDATANQRLRSDELIAKETGLTKNECLHYRSMLMAMNWKGTPLLVKKQTSVVSNFSKESLNKIVALRLNLGGV